MGLGFELPVVILTLVKIGVLDYAHAVEGAPLHDRHQPDSRRGADDAEPITQLVMFVPLQVLYEFTVWIAWYWDQPDRAEGAAETVARAAGVAGDCRRVVGGLEIRLAMVAPAVALNMD